MPSVAPTAERERLAIVSALEACEVGDYRYAVEILLTALEDDRPRARSFVCPCGPSFEWPGLLDHHQRFAHPNEVDFAHAV
jgi:hypothetical protein